MKYLVLILALFITGCNTINTPVNIEEKHVIVDVYEDVNSLTVSFSQASKEDLVERYKFFRGMALFCENAPSDMKMSAIRSALSQTQSRYGWSPQKYPNISKDVIDFMTSKGWYKEDLPNENISVYRDTMVKTFNTLAEACKRAIQTGLDT